VSRRTLTLLLSSTFLVVFALLAGSVAVPYVALAPGPTFDTLGENAGTEVLTVTGRPTFPDEGQLDLTTISVIRRLTFVQAVRGWFRGDLAVVPREGIFAADTTDEEVREKDQVAMTQSKDSATTAALRQLGVPSKTKVIVGPVEATSPAAGKLMQGDVLTAVDAKPVADATRLRALIGARTPGGVVRISFVRAGKPGTAVITTAPATDETGKIRPVIGVLTAEQVDFPVKVDIQLKKVGGPSAGLMFALGIVDKLTPGALTKGKHIAGTGTIADDGTVGPIGGIQQKLIGAKRKGAVAFLVPQANCPAALNSPPKGLTLIQVTSLKDALGQLERFAAGKPTAPCTK